MIYKNNQSINIKHRYKELQAEVIRLQQENVSLKKELQDLHSVQEKFSKAFYNNQTGMAISRLDDGVYIDVNAQYADSMGYKREEMIGKNVLELDIWGEQKDRRDMHEQLAKVGNISDSEYKFRRKTGEIGYAISSIALLNINGVEHILTSFVDTTKRKKIEEALRKSQELFQQVFNIIPISIAIIAVKDRKIIEVNDTFLSKHNLVRENILDEIFIGEEPYGVEKHIETIMKNGIEKNVEATFQATDGGIGTALLSGVSINWYGEECILFISNDITEMKKYQKEMSRLDNLNLMGQIAASLAHEIRNPMTSIKGFLQLFQRHDKYREDKEAIDLMIEEIDRINEIITTFLSLAKKKAINLKLQSLNEKVESLLPLIVADAWKNDIYISTELADIPKIMIDEGEIRQLLLNLVRNGIQAMPSGGTLTIKTFEDSHGVNLNIEDQGHGISSEVLEKIGTPFFTTKDTGTGLGLAVCNSIAARHNAAIAINTCSQGTVFKVVFPVAG